MGHSYCRGPRQWGRPDALTLAFPFIYWTKNKKCLSKVNGKTLQKNHINEDMLQKHLKVL